MTDHRAILTALILVLACPQIGHADDREAVKLPDAVKHRFLEEMRSHMGHLDDILAALAERDFREAAKIAEIGMGFGHMHLEAMAERGATDEELAKARAKILSRRERMHAGGGPGSGRGMAMGGGMDGQMAPGHRPGMGMDGGFGRYMPPGFRDMGQQFHAAAGDFAETVRAASDPPTAEDYRAALESLQAVTVMCRSCHDTYRIE